MLIPFVFMQDMSFKMKYEKLQMTHIYTYIFWRKYIFKAQRTPSNYVGCLFFWKWQL